MFFPSSLFLQAESAEHPSTMATILVTGASGFVGSHVVPALIAAGHRVVGLVRDEDTAALVRRRLPAGQRDAVETRIGDVTKPATLPAALAGVDTVVHLAAIPRDFDGGQSLRLINTEGTRNVVHAARDAGVRRFVHQGALAVVDDPTLHYASSKAKAMAIVRESGLDWTILAPSLLFGPRDGFFNLIAGLVRMSPGVVPITGTGRGAVPARWRSTTTHGWWSPCSPTTPRSGASTPSAGRATGRTGRSSRRSSRRWGSGDSSSRCRCR